jgi:hypothetical protein
MEYNELKDYLAKNLSIREITDESKKCSGSVRYWMKKYGLKANFKSFKDGHDFANGSAKQNKRKIKGDTRYCPHCNLYKKFEEFYVRRGNNYSGHCKKCVKEQTVKRGRQLKLDCLDYKGGKCQKCGYNKCQASLEFHHRDPNEKDFPICQKYGCRKISDRIKRELDKCDLLCANCHREEHWMLRQDD